MRSFSSSRLSGRGREVTEAISFLGEMEKLGIAENSPAIYQVEDSQRDCTIFTIPQKVNSEVGVRLIISLVAALDLPPPKDEPESQP